MTFKYKLEAFEQDLKKKIKNIPAENLQEPPLMIAGPVLEALKYTYDEDYLREMYENLLASAMDNRNTNNAHPSFVDAIKQMSPLDARIYAFFFCENLQKFYGKCKLQDFSFDHLMRSMKARDGQVVEMRCLNATNRKSEAEKRTGNGTRTASNAVKTTAICGRQADANSISQQGLGYRKAIGQVWGQPQIGGKNNRKGGKGEKQRGKQTTGENSKPQGTRKQC